MVTGGAACRRPLSDAARVLCLSRIAANKLLPVQVPVGTAFLAKHRVRVEAMRTHEDGGIANDL